MKPDYSNSIVNLVSSILAASGASSPYEPLDARSLSGLEDTKNIVSLVVDGLGYNFLRGRGSKSSLVQHIRGSITSVFPPSTGSAMTSIYTGLAPQQHSSTGWWVFLKEFGLVSRILPYCNAIDYNVLGESISWVIDVDLLPSQMKRNYSVVLDNKIVDSEYTKYVTKNARRFGFTGGSEELFRTIGSVIKATDDKKYIHAYWPALDDVSHVLGPKSKEAFDELTSLEKQIKIFLESVEGTSTTIIITGDHGFVDVPLSNTILTRDYPEFEECLVLPVCGDTRCVFCYVRPWHTEKFESYVQNKFGDICEIHRSNDLVEQGWFGMFDANPKLNSRIGDYTLIFKDKYALLNTYPGRSIPDMLGHHGGVTPDEMLVPLIVVDR